MNQMVKILKTDENTVKVIFPYNPEHVKKIKAIDGRKWHTEEKQSATSTLNQAINALKFYYGTMLKKKFVYEVKRPCKDKKLPVVLSKEEMIKIFSSVSHCP